MRPVLRVLGSRYGLALLALLAVLAVVGVTRSIHGTRPLAVDAGAPEAVSTVDPRTGDDGVSGPDGAVGGSPPATATPPDGAAEGPASAATPGSGEPAGPDPAPAASAFLRAWLAHTGVTAARWYAGIEPLSTPALAAKLRHTDPAGVPASRLTGPLGIVARSADTVEVTARVDSGSVRLRLVLVQGRWLVDGVDWDRS